MSSAIQTENLVKKFRRVEALKGLNLQVPQGAIYALGGAERRGEDHGHQDSNEHSGADQRTRPDLLMLIQRSLEGKASSRGSAMYQKTRRCP